MLVFDIECYPNYFLLAFKKPETGQYKLFDKFDKFERNEIIDILRRHTIIGFNSNRYDIPMLHLALGQATQASLFENSNKIINNERIFYTKCLKIDSIDLMGMTPKGVSLKMLGARMHCKTIQELPYDPLKDLNSEQIGKIREYCKNDLDITEMLYNILIPQIELREYMSKEYKMDLRSKKDAQIAERVMISMCNLEDTPPSLIQETFFNYIPPPYIKFVLPELIEAKRLCSEVSFSLDATGKIKTPESINKYKIEIGGKQYTMGIGGLHSTESKRTEISNGECQIIDRDVTGYYPNVIINCNFYPKNIGPIFLDTFRKLKNEREEAKKNRDSEKSASLKIITLSCFGKFAEPHSKLFSPDIFIAVVMTGQLSILMLIESLHLNGIEVISANTDGITIKTSEIKKTALLIETWEKITGLTTEETLYKSIHNQSVNSYLAVKADNSIKFKGDFSDESDIRTILNKNRDEQICTDAIVNLLLYKKPVDETIKNCLDIRKFIKIRKVLSGAYWKGEYNGHVVRWIHTTDGHPVLDGKNRLVATANKVTLLQKMTDWIENIDYGYYITKTTKSLANMGLDINGSVIEKEWVI